MYQCLCCGCYTLPVPPEDAIAYICPVCFWENDVFIKSDNEPSDENHGLTLQQARKNYAEYGACCLEMKQHTRRPTEDETGECTMLHNEIEKTLVEAGSVVTDLLASLKPAPYKPDEETPKEMITFDRTETDNSKWKTLLAEYLKTAKAFEIHCWNEEAEWIEVAMQYGTLKESDWQYGKIITGPVTKEFAKMLLNIPKPTDTELENKMTPFFNVFLDESFSSSHYGTEIYYDGN
ncbi:CPCC family cysteine-rich protein [Ruthenibacterium lactatiformans]|uniref:CPCC family cysteine-rich protein n=1 Tax=Ruthenibacterium lactatiformans TaxID=1550024 RepID=UPI003AB5B6B3